MTSLRNCRPAAWLADWLGSWPAGWAAGRLAGQSKEKEETEQKNNQKGSRQQRYMSFKQISSSKMRTEQKKRKTLKEQLTTKTHTGYTHTRQKEQHKQYVARILRTQCCNHM